MAEGLLDKDFKITAFVKFEQLKGSRYNRAPRIIQFPKFKEILYFMRFIKPIEKRFPDIKDFTGTSMFFKGMNPKQRAETILHKWSCFKRPVALSGDGTQWDVNVTYRALQVKHQFYRMIIRDAEFHRHVAKELKTVAYTRAGLRAEFDGNVKSGRADTGAGNSILAVTMIDDYFSQIISRMICPYYAVADDGDDFHVYIERDDLPLVSSTIKEVFATYGHELKLEGVTDNIHKIDFCQSRLVFTVVGPVMVRHPAKVLSNALCTNKFKSPNAMRRFVRAVGECELSLNLGVPVLQAFAMALIRNTQGVKPLPKWEIESFQHRVWIMEDVDEPVEITTEARVSFQEAFDYSWDEQVSIELALSKWVIDFDTITTATEDFSPVEWIETYGPETLWC